MNPRLVEKSASTRLPLFWARGRPRIVGTAIFLFVLGIVHYFISLDARRAAAEQHAAMIDHAATLRLRLLQELSGVLYLSSGLRSYISVHHTSLNETEIVEILSRIHSESRHVRNFGIAIGTTLRYVFPVKGNESAIGLHYPDLPAQWPDVKAVIESGQPLLAGPVKLVQGGHGFVYRVPITISGHYWGLLSTVVDPDTLLAAAFANIDSVRFEFSLRGASARGRRGAHMFGDETLFDEPGTEVIDIAVPGGTWELGIKMNSSGLGGTLMWTMRVLTMMLSLLAGWCVYFFLSQGARLERMALYDSLTGLPNRSLIEDRARSAVLRQSRAQGARSDNVAAFMMIDLNGFKLINDRYGHKAGDLVLQEIGKRVPPIMRATDSVGRWGGDEFVVILQDIERQKVSELANRIRETFELPIPHGSHSLQIGAAIGIAIIPDDGDSVTDLLRYADRRMYQSKPHSRKNPA